MTTTLKDSPAPGWWRAKVVELFGADLRSLALFRIVLGLLVLADLANRATDLFAHYTDAGVLPRTVLVQEVLSPWAFSLNLMNGQPFFQALLFCVAAVAALGLLVGYRTRLMTVVVWVLLLSIQWRNPLVGGADGPLLRLMLFWAMFLPLGAYWSVDRALKDVSLRLSTRFLSLATVGLFMQIAFVYWFTAAMKSGPEWRTDGTALYYALSIDQIATPFGHFLLNFPDLLTVMTFGTFCLEALGPFLLFCPFFTGPVRTGAVMAFMGLHFGIWLSMDIGIFPWISAFCMVCFLPTWFWDVPLAKLRAALPEWFETVALRLQNAASHVVRDRLSPLHLRLAPATGAAVPDPVLGGDHIGSRLARIVSLPRTLISGTPPQDEPAAGHGTPNGPPVEPQPRMLRSSLVTNLLAFIFLMYVLCWNLTTVNAFTMPERLFPVGPFLGLDQYWGMFAPSPSKEDGWYVIPGNLRDGQQTDLMSVTRDDYGLHQVSWAKPKDVPATFKNEHWRKYLENIYSKDHADQRLYFGQYICRQWNARHTGAEQLETFKITYMLEMTQPDYKYSAPQKMVLWEHSCF
ncbi:MAG TPA: HTTM domain-containing protein [Rubrobacter sp.]|nr:HTTM domain-containing protein [Rubrobacter sp.]